MSEKKRQSNFELLRIVSMLMIIGHHLASHGGLSFDSQHITANRLWTQFLMYGGHIGLDAFVLISGYFMVEEKSFKLTKIVRMWLMMLTYSIVIYYITKSVNETVYHKELRDFVFLPINNEFWGFASAYFVLMIFAPFINVLLNKISKNAYRVMLVTILILWSIVPTVSKYSFGGNYFTWLAALYSIAGYIKLYPEDFSRGKSFYRKWMFILWGLSFLSAVVLDLLGFKFAKCAEYATHFSGMQHINIVLTAVCMFLTFMEVSVGKNGYSKAVNLVASTTFAVYLIHDDYFLRDWLWGTVFNNTDKTANWWFIPETVGEIIVIFAGCMVIELVRQNLLEKYYMKGISKLLEKPQAFIDKMMD